jgi:hypothetical protein
MTKAARHEFKQAIRLVESGQSYSIGNMKLGLVDQMLYGWG